MYPNVRPGVFNAYDYGALGVGGVDQAGALQAAINAAAAQRVGAGGAGGLGLGVVPRVWLPKGNYQIASTVSCGNVELAGDEAHIYSLDPSFPLLRLTGFFNRLSGLILDGGSRHVQIDGPFGDAGTTFIDLCDFKVAGDVCIWAQGLPLRMTVERSRFYNSPVFRGGGQNTTFRACWVSWDQTRGHCFDTNAVLVLDDVMGVTQGALTLAHAWIRANCAQVVCTKSRFGEGRGVVLLTEAVMTGDNPAYNSPTSDVRFRDCAVTCTDHIYWAYLKTVLPCGLRVESSLAPGSFASQSQGILVDDAALASIYSAGMGGQDNWFHFDDQITGVGGHRMFDAAGNQLNAGRLAQFVRMDRVAEPVVQPGSPWPAGAYSVDQPGWGGILAQNLSPTPTVDTSTGYSLAGVTVTAQYGQYGMGYAPFGAGLLPGAYCFSLLIKSDCPGSIELQYKDRRIGVALYPDTKGGFHRVWAPFYHDGTNQRFGFATYFLQAGQHFTAGLPALTPGLRPPPYVPGIWQ